MKINIIFNSFKTIILDDINPSLYWDIDMGNGQIIPSFIPFTFPESPYMKGLFLYKKEGSYTEILTGHIPNLLNQNFTLSKIKAEYSPISLTEKPFLKTLRDYQITSVRKILQYKRGIISIPTGGGKTYIISELIHQSLSIPTLVLVPTISLLHQTVSAIKSYFSPYDVSIGRVGDGYLELNNNITVAIPDTLYNRREELTDFFSRINVLIVDEVHLMMSTSLLYIYSYLTNCSFKIGLSATPQYSSLMEGIFGPIIHKEEPMTLMENNIIQCPEVIFYEVPPKLNLKGDIKQWVERRDVTNKDGKFDHYKYNRLQKELIINNHERNSIIVDKVHFHYLNDRGPIVVVVTTVNGDNSQADILHPLLESRLGISIPILKGTNSSKLNKIILSGLNEGKYPVVIAGPKIFQVGTDIPILNSVIMANVGKNSSNLIQQIGRALRNHPSNTKRPLIVSLFDKQFPFHNQSKSRLSTCIDTYGLENVSYIDIKNNEISLNNI